MIEKRNHKEEASAVNRESRPTILSAPPADARLGPVHHVNQRVTLKSWETLADWEERATELRRHILSCAGLQPLPDRTPLEAELLNPRKGDGFTVWGYRFQSLPGFWVNGNLFTPTGDGPFPAVLNPHGHWQSGRIEHSERGSVPARGVAFARMGAVALTVDMVGYNDSDQVEHRFSGPAEHLWGFGPLGLQLWNLIRAVDFLEELDIVDNARIGCTGASGGGTQTFLLTAVEPRIRVAAPVNMISAHMHGGCACENAPMLRIEANNVEIGALAAPRPLLMASATGDWTVDTPQVEFPAVQQVYALYGEPEQVECVQVDAPHNYNAETRAHVYRFFARRLLDKPDIDVSTLEVPLPCNTEELRLYPRESRPKHALSQSELFDSVKARHRRRMDAPLDSQGAEQIRTELTRLLHWRAPSSDDVRIRVVDEEQLGSRILRRMTLGSQAHGEAIPVLLEWNASLATRVVPSTEGRREWPQAASGPVMLHVASSPSPILNPNRGSRRADETSESAPIVCRLEPFLTGSYVSPAARTGRNTGVTHFEGYNLTDAAWRALDIALVAAWLRIALGRSSHLEAEGEAGPWGLVAMALTGDIESAALDVAGLMDDDRSFIEKLYIPHLLRLGGMRSLIALCAPRPLKLTGLAPELNSVALELYASAGAAGQLSASTEAPAS